MLKNNIFNKKIIIPLVLIVFIICIIEVRYKESKIIYTDVVVLNYTDFTKHFNDTYNIKIKNDTDGVRAYSIKWIDVKNDAKYQNKFLYEISCDGDNCNAITPSQMPVSGFNLLSNIFVEPDSEKIYTVRITYKGKKDKKGSFKGKLILVEGVTDQVKYDDYMKRRNLKQEFIEKAAKELQDLDDK